MGLDQYLYVATRETLNRRKEYQEKLVKYESAVGAALDAEECKWGPFFDSLPKNEYGVYDFDKFTSEQRKMRQRYLSLVRRTKKKFAKKFGLELDDSEILYPVPPDDLENAEELCYWRKNWDLHNYIVEHFWADKENDNCVDIPLGKEQLKELVKAGFDPDVFTQAYESLDDENVVYYHPWY